MVEGHFLLQFCEESIEIKESSLNCLLEDIESVSSLEDSLFSSNYLATDGVST